MKFPLLPVLAAALSLLTAPAWGQDSAKPAAPAPVVIGGRAIVVPAPDGFVRCDGASPEWDRMIASFLPPSNRLLANFGTPEDLETLKSAGSPDFSRNFNLQTLRALESREISELSFAESRDSIRKEVDGMKESIEKEINKSLDSGNAALKEQYGVDAALSVSDMAVIGYFEDSGSALGFTMAMKVGVQADEKMSPARSVAAALVTPVNGRLCFFYCTAPYVTESDRTSAEQAVSAWRDKVVAANPRIAGESGLSSILKTSLIGAGIGLGVVLVRMLSAKKIRNA